MVSVSGDLYAMGGKSLDCFLIQFGVYPVGSSSLESGDGLGDLNLMKQPSNTQTLVLHWDWLVRGMCVLGFLPMQLPVFSFLVLS